MGRGIEMDDQVKEYAVVTGMGILGAFGEVWAAMVYCRWAKRRSNLVAQPLDQNCSENGWAHACILMNFKGFRHWLMTIASYNDSQWSRSEPPSVGPSKVL